MYLPKQPGKLFFVVWFLQAGDYCSVNSIEPGGKKSGK
jgi:hypothetical protein